MLYFSTDGLRNISQCSINYSPEGILHPDRIMDEYDFLYIQNGTWDIWEEDQCYHLKKGQLLILEPGRRHYSLEKCSREMRNTYIHCSVLPGDGLSTPESICLQKVTDCTRNPQIEQLFLQMFETYWAGPPHADFRLSTLMNLLLTELEISREGDRQQDSLIRKIIHQFCCDTDRFFSPQELADQHQLSIRSLSSRFKAATGTSIHQYQLTLKLNLAHEQLRLNPGCGFRDVALSFGFYDEFHFSKLFKRQFGYAPSELRKKEAMAER